MKQPLLLLLLMVISTAAWAESSFNLATEIEHQSKNPNHAGIVIDLLEAGISLDLGAGFDLEYLTVHDDGQFSTETAQLSYNITPDTSIMAGKNVLPFGRYESTMTFEPLTLQMSETIADYIGVQIALDYGTYQLYAFENRHAQENDYGVGTRAEFDLTGLTLGFSAISSLTQSGAFTDLSYADEIAAVGLDASYAFSGVELYAELFSALDTLENTNDTPAAFHLEVASSVMPKISLAASYQVTEGAKLLEVEKSRVATGIFYQGHEHWRLGIELYESKDQTSATETGVVAQFKFEI